MERAIINRRDALQYFASVATLGLMGTSAMGEEVCSPTRSDTPGPFYVAGAPHRTAIAGPDEPGERILIQGTVFGPDCKTRLSDAMLDIWHADAGGRYHNEKENYRLRGWIKTSKEGSYEFTSIHPGRYDLGNGYRPAHIHLTISHPDCASLTTQLYFKGDPYLFPKDACGDECKSNDPNRIIELKTIEKDGKTWLTGTFDIMLQYA